MARKQRLSVPDGTYHVTTRVVNREFWFADAALKDEIVGILHGTASFSGVELLSWAVMDNHVHVLVHVPEVPERLRLDPAVAPPAYAFGMRPPETGVPLWSSSDGASPGENALSAASCGASPSENAPVCGARPSENGLPPVGFRLDDEEMLARLGGLYGAKKVDAMRKHWAKLREQGDGVAVERAKDAYCRRMYNLTQFVKTFKERIALAVRRHRGCEGHVFDGRFWSTLVDRDSKALQVMSLYVDNNPYKAGIAKAGKCHKWSSFGEAMGDGPHAETCRRAYEKIWGCAWTEARERILSVIRERSEHAGRDAEEVAREVGKLRPSQLVHLRVKALTRGGYFGRRTAFARECADALPAHYRTPSERSLAWCAAAIDWRVA